MSNEINTEDKTNDKKAKTKAIISWTLTIVICLVIAKLFTTFVVRSVEIDGSSMSSTLSDGDRALTDALFYKFNDIKRFDIVIIKRNNSKDELIKRVIALPNETLEYKDGVLYINDEVVEEPFIDEVVSKLTGNILKRTLKENEYYVLGDNRANSLDSRSFGTISKKEIKGRGILRFMVCTKKEDNECVKRKLVWFSKVR